VHPRDDVDVAVGDLLAEMAGFFDLGFDVAVDVLEGFEPSDWSWTWSWVSCGSWAGVWACGGMQLCRGWR